MTQSPVNPSESDARPAAQYIRMSTEHQQYSTENQADVIREYAQKRGYRIVKTYADEGKSGLRIEGRNALCQMIDDVQADDPGYEAILAYDISRWGRFQDSDESAYYEYICKRAGIQVLYCAEQFENDGSPTSTIIKSVKRAMAGEYSRELSSKVFKGQCKLIELGYRQGGPAGFGLRRMLIDIEGKTKGILKRGEQKSLQTDRVVLVPGPDEEVSLVRHMYQLFIKHGKIESEIAEDLNRRGILTDAGRQWNRSTVHQVLTNEKYIGNNVYNRISFKLKKKRIVNPPDIWVRADGVYEAIIDPPSFFTAQGIIQERNRRFSNEELIAMLSRLIEQHSDISAHLIDQTEGIPSSATYRARFGTLVQAYRLAGFEPQRDFSYVEIMLGAVEEPLVRNAVHVAKVGVLEPEADTLAREVEFLTPLPRQGEPARAMPPARVEELTAKKYGWRRTVVVPPLSHRQAQALVEELQVFLSPENDSRAKETMEECQKVQDLL